MQEGDTIYIPQATDLLPEEISEIASASFAPDIIRINVVGEVDQPGLIEVPPNTPLSQGILAAGGFNNRASTGVVELIRLNANGTASNDALPVDFAEGIDEEMNPLLRNNDTIVVRRSTSASFGDTLDNFVGAIGQGVVTVYNTCLNIWAFLAFEAKAPLVRFLKPFTIRLRLA